MSPLRLLLAIAGFALLTAPVAAQDSSDLVRGRVTEPGGAGIRDAEVRITRIPEGVSRTARTDADGRYMVTFPPGGGEYYLLVTAPGRQIFRARLSRPHGERAVTGDASLAAAEPIKLAPLNVRVQRTQVPRGAPADAGVGAAEETADGVPAALSPGEAGDLAAIAATTPGAVVTPGGVSFLGLDPGQNNATLNGLDFAGGSVPRDVTVRTRVTTATYDPARGGFGGAQLALELAPGSVFSLRRAHVSLSAPPIEHLSASPGGGATGVQLSGGGEGELVPGRYYYNAGFQLSRNVVDLASRAGFDAWGIAPDSARRFLAALSAAGIPSAPGASSHSDDAVLLGRIDRTPNAARSWGVTLYGRLARTDAVAPSLATVPARDARSLSAVGSIQAVHSAYFRRHHLNETRTAFTYSASRSNPYLDLPGGRVTVASAAGGEGGGIAVLGFGGSGTDLDSRSWTWEAVNETQWHSWDNSHRPKLYLQSRLDGFERTDGAGRLGTFTYHSLDDLAAGRPASFSRALNAPAASGTRWSGVVAVGDTWRRSPALQLLYGVRVEADRFFQPPAFDRAVHDAFGVRTDAAPGAVHASPRFGFTWAVRGRSESPGFSAGALGTRYHSAAGVLRGGFGEFRGLVPADLMRGALLANAAEAQLTCVGSAVPVPDWRSFQDDPATIPTECAGEGGAPGFADSAPRVELFDRGYEAPRSWRGNLAWSSRFRRVGFTVEGIYSLNLNRAGVVDLNFAGVPRFVLGEEGSRPVYTAPGTIVPATGYAGPAGARLAAGFGRVLSHRSDLRSVGRQVTITATPELPFDRYFLSLAYTAARSRAQFRGFDAAGFGDPAGVEWAPSSFDVRHQFQVQAGWSRRGVSVTLFGRLASGLPFTPVVLGDVNGDGVGGDRAFVFDPALARDSALAGQLGSLLRTAPAPARRCLAGQMGREAGRNSCRGPWTQHLNVRLALGGSSPGGGGLRNRARAAVNFENPLGGLDWALHGAELRGWGTPSRPDPVLYRVRGFDPAAERFLYDVNPGFGRAREPLSRAPFRVTVDFSVNLGRPIARQQLDLSLRPGRGRFPGPKPTAEALKTRYARNVPDIYQRIIAQSDSLLLSAEQVEALRAAQTGYRARSDSVWTPFASYLAQLPDDYDGAEALRRQEEATDQAWEVSRGEGPVIRSILSPFQIQLLGGIVRTVIESREKLNIRIYRP